MKLQKLIVGHHSDLIWNINYSFEGQITIKDFTLMLAGLLQVTEFIRNTLASYLSLC